MCLHFTFVISVYYNICRKKNIAFIFLHHRLRKRKLELDLEGWLRAVDRSGIPGKFKAWVYQHGILARILLPLLIYEFPMMAVEGFERKMSSYLRRWLGLPRSLRSIGLYRNSNTLRHSFSSVREEFIVPRTREHIEYTRSRDTKVSGAGIVLRTGRMWRAANAVIQAEAQLKHRPLLGIVAQSRDGLGSIASPQYDTANWKERQTLVQKEMCASVEEE